MKDERHTASPDNIIALFLFNLARTLQDLLLIYTI